MTRLWRLLAVNGAVLFSSSLTTTMADLQWQPLGEPSSGGRMDAVAVNPWDNSHVLLSGDILGTGVSFDAGRTWLPTTGFDAWEHSDFTFLPNQDNVPSWETTVWAATLSGPYLSLDGGCTWQAMWQGLFTEGRYPAAMEKILVDPDDPSTLYGFGGDHRQLNDYSAIEQVPNYGTVWKYEDETWSVLSKLPGNIVAVTWGAVDTVLWAVTALEGLFKSNDRGANWDKIEGGGLPSVDNPDSVHFTGVVVDPADPNVVMVTIGIISARDDLRQGIGGVWRSENGGTTWTVVAGSSETYYWPSDMRHISRSQDGQIVWATDTSFSDYKGAYRSVDRGQSFVHVLNRERASEVVALNDMVIPNSIGGWWISVSPANSETVYLATSDLLIRTEDNGNRWFDALNSVQDSDKVRGNGYSGWASQSIKYSPYDSDLIVVQAKDSLVACVSRNAGFSFDFRQPGLPLYNGGNDVGFAENGVMFVALGQGGSHEDLVYRSTDNGTSWSKLSAPTVGSRATSILVYAERASTLFVVVDGTLFRTDNAFAAPDAVAWNDVAVTSPSSSVLDIEACPSDPESFYVATDVGVFVTRNMGENFISTAEESGMAATGPKSRVSLSADPSQSDVMWAASDACCGEAGVYRYDRTTGWKNVALGGDAERWARNVAINPVDSNIIAVVTGQDPYVAVNGGTGVWLSMDGGATFQRNNSNLPILRFKCATFSPDGTELLVGSGGRGFFRASLPQTPDSIVKMAEAEHLTVGAGLEGVYTLATDPSASGGAFVVPDQDFAEFSLDAPTLVFVFTIPSTIQDEHVVRIRCRGTGKIYTRLDFGPWNESVSDSPDWSWKTISPLSLALEWKTGRHVLHIRSGGGFVALDVVELVLGSDATPSPIAPIQVTSSPTDSPASPSEPSLCFSAVNTVEVLGKGLIQLTELEIGDFARVGYGRFSRVHGFYHLHKDVEAAFLQIKTSDSKVLELTANHLVFVNGMPLRASSLQLGDPLGQATVVAISKVKRRGLYSPATFSGDIVISGVLVSTYSSHLASPLVNEHTATHVALTYHRLLCRFHFEFCQDETYNTFGVSRFISPLNSLRGIQQHYPGVLATVILITFPVFLSLFLLETIITSPFLLGTALASLSAIVAMSHWRKSSGLGTVKALL